MIDINPKKLVKTNSRKDSSIASEVENVERDDDDPLSIRDSSINFLGFLLAILTVLIPIFGILLDRPMPRDNGINSISLPDKN